MNDPHIADLPSLLSQLAQPTSRESYTEAEAKLQANYREPGFFARLQEVAADRSLNRDVRFLATLVVGREVPKKWRAKAIIPDELKPIIRSRFFEFFSEPDLPIARSQLALLVTLARQDYPRAYPTLLTDLYGPLQSSFQHVSTSDPNVQGAEKDERDKQKTILLNSCWVWNALVKEFRGVKLPIGAKLMMEFINDLSLPMNHYLTTLMSRDPVLDDWELMESARYAYKIGARLVDWEFSRPARSRIDSDGKRMTIFMASSLQHLSHLQSLRLQLLQSPYFVTGPPTPGATKTLQSVTKFIRAIGKTYVSLLHIDPKGFSDVPGAVNAVGWWWGEVGNAVRSGEVPKDEKVTDRYPKGFLLLGLTLFKNILSVLSTEHTDIFNDAFIQDAFNLIVDRLLPLTESDWEAWQADPEEWFVQEVDTGTGWSYEFRPSAERTLMGLTSAARNHNIMVPLIMQKLQEAMSTPATNMALRIRLDSILCAVGRMARVLGHSIGLEQILQPLMGAVGSQMPEDRLLKRRIAWLIGQWVSAHEESAQLPLIWQILLHMLAERGDATDIAVNLTAVISIYQCVDLWELDIAYFRPFIGQMVEEMLKVMGDAETLAGKRHILDTLTVIIERIKGEILPHLPTLSQAIPALWSSSVGLDGEWLFKASLVAMTTKLVAAIGPGTVNILPLVIPLVEESLQGVAKEHFEEDGLTLWQASLRHVTTLEAHEADSGLLKLVPFLVNLLGQNLDLQPQALALMDSYMLLDGSRLMHAYGTQITEAFKAALDLAERQSTKAVLASIDVLIRLIPSHIWGQTFASTGLMAKLCKEIDNEKSSGAVLAAYLGTLSRMIVADPQAFVALVHHVGSASGRGDHAQLEETLDAMWRAFDYIGDSSARKLVAMAFANLLTVGNPQVFERLDGETVNVFMDVLGEVKETQVDGSMGPELVRHWRDENILVWHEIQDTAEGERREKLEAQDIIYARPLTQYLSEKLSQAQGLGMGPYWNELDVDVKKQLEKLLT